MAVSLPSPAKNVNELNARLNELEPRLHSNIAYDAVENLLSADGYSLDDASQAENAAAIHQTIQPVIHVRVLN